MTQAHLAVRAGVSPSVVSAYESARREPGCEILRKLVGAAGFDLEFILTPSTARSELRTSVDHNRARLVRTLSRLGARNVRLFGSVARGDDGPLSDIDLLVDLGSDVGLFTLGRMRTEAERILGSSVDVVPTNSLKPDVAQRVLAEAIALHRERDRT
jgi:predicted nucleotidyltransferase